MLPVLAQAEQAAQGGDTGLWEGTEAGTQSSCTHLSLLLFRAREVFFSLK